MSKYEKLSDFLTQSTQDKIEISFLEIENILGFSLPKSQMYPAWWSNNPSNNVMTNVWLSAGFKTQNVNIELCKLTFVRQSNNAPSIDSNLTTQVNSPIFGCMKGTTNVSDGVDLTDPADPGWGAVYEEENYSTSDEIEAIKHDSSLNISDKIRALDTIGLKRADIARTLGKRYQHVRNVLVDAEKKAS